MKFERLIGLIFFIGTLILILFLFYPLDKNINSEKVERSNNILENKIDIENIPYEENFKIFNESDFDFFVYRAHILSSKEKSESLKNKINDGGFPSFVKPYGNKKNLFAIYVGPFLSEDDIVTNIDSIQILSESDNGEIIRWKL
tara:strand:- start:670 stop:1101 length:432 start_codon:yes stop_codon:yes gene_type:complete